MVLIIFMQCMCLNPCTSLITLYPHSSSVSLTSNHIVNELAAITSLTSNPEIVNKETTTKTLLTEYIPDIVDVIDNLVTLQ